jgi:hypothetical protein
MLGPPVLELLEDELELLDEEELELLLELLELVEGTPPPTGRHCTAVNCACVL